MNETLQRSISGSVYVALLIAATFYSKTTFFLLFTTFLGIAIYEFCQLTKIVLWHGIIIGSMLFVALHLFHQYPVFIIGLALFNLVTNAWLLFGLFKKDSVFTHNYYWYLIGYIVIPFLLLLILPLVQGTFRPFTIIGVFILIWINDTFAYIFGKWLGKHKLLERISPKKTIEGFIGGLLVTIITSCVFTYFNQDYSQLIWIMIGVIVVFLGSIGDLVESAFKRKAQVKDSGNIMPGHGGILDRLDSVIFATPFIFILIYILNYVS